MKKPRPRDRSARAATDVDRQVGANVRAVRTAQGLTLVDLSQQLGISHQQLQKYETGSNRLSAGTIVQLSQVLSVPVISLFDSTTGVKIDVKSGAEISRDICHQFIRLTQSRQKLDMMAKVLKAIHDSPLK